MRFLSVIAATCTLFSIASAATYNVSVGLNGPGYSPSTVNATSGDTVRFLFVDQSHSVTQSTFDQPCTVKSPGLDSGVLSSSSTPPEWVYTVNDTSGPLYFHCKVSSHCSAGQVFILNPTSQQSFDAFKAKAMGKSASSSSTSYGAATSTSPAGSGSGYGSGELRLSVQTEIMTVVMAGVGLFIALLS